MDGAFTAAHAWAAGYSQFEIRRHVQQGDWVRLRRGAYAQAGALAEEPARRHALELAALVEVLEFDAVGAGLTAARIWGLDTLTAPQRELVIVTERGESVGRARGDYLVRVAALPAGHRAWCHGVPVTSVARTVVDLARTRPFAEGVVVADSALRKKLTTPGELRHVVGRCRRWPGVTRAREVLAFADGRAESALESVSRVAMCQQGIPAPQVQVVIGSARVDFLWDDVRVVGEADGLAKYRAAGGLTATEIVRAEKRREERLVDAGFEIVRWGWDDAMNPQRLSRRLRVAFARGEERRRGRLAA